MNEARKARLIEKHRDINIDGGWWGNVYNTWVPHLADVGIITGADEMQFSGFWSQGDGASFAGELDMVLFLERHPVIGGAEERAVAAVEEVMCVRLRRNGSRYGHEHTISLDLDLPGADEVDLVSPVKNAVFEANRKVVAGTDRIRAFEAAILAQCRDYMRQLYRDLEKEYAHLTSDELVWEAIEACDLVDDEEDDDADTTAPGL